MQAAQEKKLKRVPEPIVNRMVSLRVVKPIATRAQRQSKSQLTTPASVPTITNRISHWDFGTRKFQKSPIGSTLKFDSIVPVENHHSRRETQCGNRIGDAETRLAPTLSFYRGWFVPNAMDPKGTQVTDAYPADSPCWLGCTKQHADGTIKEVVACYKKCKDDNEIIIGDSCSDILNPVSICRHNAAFVRAYDLYKKNCKRSVVVGCKDKGNGTYNSGDHVITLPDIGGFANCLTFAHELLHAADACKKAPPEEPGFERCRWSMCIEARANIYLNCCHERRQSGDDQECFSKCVAWRKRTYVNYGRNCRGVPKATRERYWDECAPDDLTISSVCDNPIPQIE